MTETNRFHVYLRCLADHDWGEPTGFGGRTCYQCIPALELERRGEKSGHFRNAWIDHGRRVQRATTKPLVDVAAGEETPLETTLRHERQALLAQAIDELPNEFREALLLRSGQSLSFAEIADVLGGKEDTVRWRVYKARQILLKKTSDQSSREELPL